MKKYLLLVLTFTLFNNAYAQNKQPNIVFILADDLGIGDLGCYGQTKIKTPNIDRLAARGMKFSNFYAGTTVCAPSRSSLMTGQHTGHTFIRGNKETFPEGQQPLADSVTTMATVLQNAGYTTGAFGKWGLGMVGTSGDPNKKGFDTFYGYNCQLLSHRYYPTHLWDNNKKVILEGNDLTNKVHYAPAMIQDKAIAFIEENKDKPFFLFIPTVLPHAELAVPNDAVYHLYEKSFPETPFKGNDYGPNANVGGYFSVEKPRAAYAAMVTRIDNYVGKIVAKLDELNLSDNTILIFTSDNGAHKEGGADPDFFNSTAGLRGVKRDLYEGGVKVPFIAVWPNKIKENTHSSENLAFWDIMPTFAEIGNTKVTNYTDGLSFLPTLLKKGKQQKHPYLYWEFHEGGGKQAVKSGDYKLVKLQVNDKSKTYFELYNLKLDPSESKNLYGKNDKVSNKLIKYIDEAHVESTLFPLLKK